MSWTVEYNSELRIINGRYVGRVTEVDFKEATIKAISLAKANKTNRFLIDDSVWEGSASITGLFELPLIHVEFNADQTSRAALVLPPTGTPLVEEAKFYETVCRNRGWNFRVFPECEEAIEWLLSN